METIQRSTRTQTDDDMALGPESAFNLPEGRDKISARILSETKSKLLVIMEIWKVNARVETEAKMKAKGASGKDLKEKVQAAEKDMDLTHVIDSLLKIAADKELAPWGGMPDSQEKLNALLKVVEQQARK